MWSKLALLIVLIQTGVIVAGQMTSSFAVLHQMLIYGSPVSILINLFRSGSLLTDTTPVMIVMGAGHVFKYFTFAMAQIKEDGGGLLYTAIVLEAAYLAYSAYWLI